MSRYPGTQFRVHDNSQTTAIVPVASANINDTVQYLTSFASVKGPEGITLTSGEDFYTRYGTQDNIDFKKYGQPLFQASMNINNGAALLAKRAVLDDATLGNATLGVVLTTYKNGTIELEADDATRIKSIKFKPEVENKYSLAPVMFSIDNTNNYNFATSRVDEYKERYNLYKDYIENVVGNTDTPNAKFLNKLHKDTFILSGLSQSIYYDDNNKVIDVVNGGSKANVRKVSSVTTGIYEGNQNTYSSNFTVDDVVDPIGATSTDVSNTDKIKNSSAFMYHLTKKNGKVHFEKDTANSADFITYKNVMDTPIERIFTSEEEANKYAMTADPTWLDPTTDETTLNKVKAIITKGEFSTEGYSSSVRLANDLMVRDSGYVVSEYVFPLFTIFDNGRGESIKSIGIEFDSASSMTLKKAVYSLCVYNYTTAKRLEKFSFSLNPYTRNNSTGYTFDIESSVNYNSKQISVKTYYESYDALLETIQSILKTTDASVIENNDILFGHNLNGSYPVFNSYYVSSILKRNTYIYDYAHLNIFDNDVITVNAYCDSDNMTSLEESSVKYYYYNYIRQQKRLLERLEMGTNGYCLDRVDSTDSTDKIPFIVIDSTDKENETIMNQIIEYTGQKEGAIISASDSLTIAPKVSPNFVEFKVGDNKSNPFALKLFEAEVIKDGNKVSGETVYITNNAKTLASRSVLASDVSDDVIPAKFNGYRLVKDSTKTVEAVIYIPYAVDFIYQEHYRRFFSGEFDKDVYNLDIYFPNALFDANYSTSTKMAIQRLAAYRGDFMAYMDMGINKIRSYSECYEKIPSTAGGVSLTEVDNDYNYVRDMHIAVTCLSYKIRNPYDNKIIDVTATYGLSNLYIAHFNNDVSKPFAGISNGIAINNALEGSISYIPKIYPTTEMVSLNNIGGIYPSEDETIVNEKQLMCDLRVNYGCYYDDRFSIETEYTMNPAESEFSYWNNVALVCIMMQAIRKACPTARYQFITTDDLNAYKAAVETALEPWKNRFANLKFYYIEDENAIETKTFYAAIEVVFKPFAQAEIFELTALNYSTLSSSVTNI